MPVCGSSTASIPPEEELELPLEEELPDEEELEEDELDEEELDEDELDEEELDEDELDEDELEEPLSLAGGMDSLEPPPPQAESRRDAARVAGKAQNFIVDSSRLETIILAGWTRGRRG